MQGFMAQVILRLGVRPSLLHFWEWPRVAEPVAEAR